MKKRLKIVIPILLLAGLAAAGTWWWQADENAGETAIRLYGNIDMRDAALAFNDQERISQILVEEGDQVTAGQPLAHLQTNRLAAQIKQAEAQVSAAQQALNRLLAGTRPQEIAQARAKVEAAKANVENSKSNLQRAQRTATAGASSQQALENARTQLDVDKAQQQIAEKGLNLALEGPRPEDIAEARDQLEAGKAALKLLNIRMADTTLKSPAAGVIQSRILEPGEMAGPNQPVLTLALIDPKWVRAYVPEPELGLINLGMPAKVISDSFAGRSFDGWIGFISPSAEFTPKSVETTDLRTKLVYEVRVFVHDPQNQLRLGMPVSVIVDRAAGSNAPAPADGKNPEPVGKPSS